MERISRSEGGGDGVAKVMSWAREREIVIIGKAAPQTATEGGPADGGLGLAVVVFSDAEASAN